MIIDQHAPVFHLKGHLEFDTAPYVEKIEQAKRDWFHPDGMTPELVKKMYWRCSHQWFADLNSTLVNDGPMTEEEIAALPPRRPWDDPEPFRFCGLKICMDALLKGSVCELAMDAWQ